MTSFTRAWVSASLVIWMVACERQEPTGLRGDPATVSSVLQTVYPEERPFWNLAQTVPGSAGFFIDTASGNVIISLTDTHRPQAVHAALRARFAGELAKSRAKHPGADVVSRRVAYTFLQLKEWRDRLNGQVFVIPGVVWLDLDEVRNRVVIGLESSGDPVAIRRLAGELAIPDAALDFETDGPVVLEAGLTDQIRPIAGATRIQSRPAGTTVTCTLGFPVLWNGTKSFVTASHCSKTTFGVDSTKQYQPRVPLTHADSLSMTPIGTEVADYSEPCPPKVGSLCAWADASIYLFNGSSAEWLAARIARPTYGCFPGPCNPVNLQVGGYFTIVGTDSSLVVGDLVNMIGSATGWNQSYVRKTCTNVKVGTGPVAQCQDLADYGNGAGDSGAPVLLDINTLPDTNVVLGGLHWGKTGQYGVFSPWSGIAKEYPGLVVTAPAIPPVPAVPPDSEPADLYADSLIVRSSPELSAPFLRNTIVLLFKAGTPQAERQAAIDQISGRVVGGYPLADGDGFYLVKIVDDGTTGPLFAAVSTLEARPSVEMASPHILIERPLNYLRPLDGRGWGKSDWTMFVDSASGDNWGPEAIAAPLAWGCSTGDSTMTVAMVDHGVYVGVSDLDPNVSFTYRPNGFPSEDHASGVASVLAAVGNNGVGITGMLWHTKLRAYEAASFTSSGTPTMYHGLPVYIPSHTAAVVSAAAASGARVINVSMGYIWGLPPTFSKGDSASIRRVVQPMADVLRRIPASTSPLIVFSAGNDKLDAWWNAYPVLVDTFPDRVVVVGASMIGNRQLWDSSNTGRLVTLAAPGVDVTVLNRFGQPVSGTGSSIAAPFVSGVAGLLFSFRPELRASDVVTFLTAGAQAGGRVASGVPVLNAYESLKLAAQRFGAPLCGNRVWASGRTIYAQRDTASSTGEALANLANGSDTASYVNVFHGGRRIEVFDRNFFTQAFRYVSPGNWQETTDTAVTLPGGTFSSFLWYSHDRDSVADVVRITGDGSVTLDVGVRAGTSPRRSRGTIPVALATADTTCIRLQPAWTDQSTSPPTFYPAVCVEAVPNGTTESMNWNAAFGLTGGQIFVSVSKLQRSVEGISGYFVCPGENPDSDTSTRCRDVSWLTSTEASEVWSVPTDSSGPRRLWSFPSPKLVFWLAGSEDGNQVVTGEGQWQQRSRLTWASGGGVTADPAIFSGCGIGYRRATSGMEATPLVPTPSVCLGGGQGQGTIAPAPPRSRP